MPAVPPSPPTPVPMPAPIPASPPRRRPPAGAVDAHMHIMGPAARYPLAAGAEYAPPDCQLPAYRAMCATLGIARTVVVQPSVYGTDNACTLDAVRALGPAAGRGIAVLDASASDATLRELDAAGFVGTRFNLVNGQVDVADLQTVAAKVAPRGWHIQVFATGARLAELADTLLALPCDVVVDHHGMVDGPAGAQFDALARLLDSGRAWVKLAGLYRVDTAGGPAYPRGVAIGRALVARAPERLVWGSDWPHPSLRGARMPDDGWLLDGLADAAGDDGTLARILVDNPAPLYRFG